MTEPQMAIDPALLLLLLLFFAVFWFGMRTGARAEHERQRRFAKLRGRLNSVDPADVTNVMLDKIEAALPAEKGKA